MFLEIEQVDKSVECDSDTSTFLTFLPQTTITQRVVHVAVAVAVAVVVVVGAAAAAAAAKPL